jgi:hypothetical protein
MRSVAAVVLVLAVAGCGGEARLSQQELLTRADGICAEVNQGLVGIREPADLRDLAPVLDEGLVVVDDGVAELRELRPPAELEDGYDAWLDEVEASAEALEEASAAARRNDQAAVGLALQESDDKNTEANRLAARLGLTDCAQD